MHVRQVRVPLEGRVGNKKLKNGNYEVAVVRGSEILIFELPKEAWEEIKKAGYITLTEQRRRQNR